jgi:hypothetical protein
MTILNVLHAHDGVFKAEGKAGCSNWCRKQFLNERALLEARRIRDQLRLVGQRMGLECQSSSGAHDTELVLKSLIQGFLQNSALLQADGSYKQTIGQTAGWNQRHDCILLIE